MRAPPVERAAAFSCSHSDRGDLLLSHGSDGTRTCAQVGFCGRPLPSRRTRAQMTNPSPGPGSWSYFVCPKCSRRAKKLWLVDDAPRCRLCLEKLGVRYRAAYGFGRSERLRERDRRVDKLQAMLEGGPMRIKPVPPNWGNRRLDRRNRLTWALQQARIATRLTQIAYQHQQSSEPHGPSPLLRAYKPLAAAIEAIPNLKLLWWAKSTEDLEQALDKAQATILEALQSNDPQTRLNAATIMLRSRQARERGRS